MNPTGAAIYFDGETTTRQSVTVEVAPGALLVRDGAGRELAAWPYGELEEISSHDGVLRVGRAGTGSLARIEVRDAALAYAEKR
ncbi:MAG: hypothetical protein J0H62_08895, partial [Rhizobiales bacterium]|nr:hypothetical protein [Hyphomicrobiales bacterium]